VSKIIKVMVVDDNKEFCEILKEYLESQGDFVVTGIAYNGFQALDLLKQEIPDVMILDIIMPHLDGSEFWKEFL